jgi:UPF0271 protein
MIKNGTVKAVTGREIPVKADSVCIHGDGEKALLFAEKLNAAITKAGITIAGLEEICARKP